MTKYIDVSKYSGCALVPVDKSEDGFAGYDKVDYLETADVQEVVRCKDCKYLIEGGGICYCYGKNEIGKYTTEEAEKKCEETKK